MPRSHPGTPLVQGFVAVSLALSGVSGAVFAAPSTCPSDAGVHTCVVQDGDSTLQVRASSLDGGWVWAEMGRGGAYELAFEGFRIWSFDVDEFLDVVLESATQDAATAQIRVQFREVFSSAVRAVGVIALSEQGDATVLDEAISVQNLLPEPVSGRLYVVTDFDLDFDVLDGAISVTQSGTRIVQSDGATTALLEAVGEPPTDWDVAACCTLSNIMTGSGLVELLGRNTVPGPADFQAALTWDRQIGVGQTATVALRKTHVPEPAAVTSAAAALLALGGLACARRRSAVGLPRSRPRPGGRRRRDIQIWIAGLSLWAAPPVAFAQTTVFPGGSLTSLRALSPSLVFGSLVIDGPLEIDLSTDAGASDVVIRASRFELTSRGSIVDDQAACSYLRSPNLTIDASGEVLLDGYIHLRGKSGDVEIDSTSPTLCPETECNQCFGIDAGDLTIRGQSIRIRGSGTSVDLDVSGGGGSTIQWVEYDIYNGLCLTVARTGCSGGDGGRLRLEGRSRIDLEGAGFELGGGDGGYGIPEGPAGTLAELEWSAPLVAVQEIEPNGSVDVGDASSFPGRAQPLAAAPVRVQGFVSYQDDALDPDPITVTFAPPNPNDRLEDLYILYVPTTAPVALELQAVNPQRDLDLYLIDPFAFRILGESNGPPGQIERIDRVLTRGWYVVGASWCCDLQPLPVPPGTAYELRVITAPEPAGAALGGAAMMALASLAVRRRRRSGMRAGAAGPAHRDAGTTARGGRSCCSRRSRSAWRRRPRR